MTLQLLGFESGTWDIDVSVTNTSQPEATVSNGDVIANGSRLTAVGFRTTPLVTAAITSTGWKADDGQFPGFTTDFCRTNTLNCASARNNDSNLRVGETGTFNMQLTQANWSGGSELVFDFFGVRMASLTPTGENISTSTTFDGAAIPLPAAGWLLLSGLGALGFIGHRRRKTAA